MMSQMAQKDKEEETASNVNPLAPMNDQQIISPYNINTKLSRQVMRTQKNINKGTELIHDQILNPKMIGNVWQRVRRISNEILGVTGLNIFVCFLQVTVTV